MLILPWLVALAALLFGSTNVLAGVQAHSIAGMPPGVWELTLSGEITAADAAQVTRWRHQYGRIGRVSLQSPGGDVAAAMQIGRWLRADLAEGSANRCASACVLVYVGLVKRPFLHDGALAIHRPIGLSGAQSYAAEQAEVDRRNAWIEKYLRDMNVSPRLLDAMNEVPNTKVRTLSRSEAESYGITEFDPVFLEQRQGALARRLGISMLEAQRRTNLAIRQCDAQMSSARLASNELQVRGDCVRAVGLM